MSVASQIKLTASVTASVEYVEGRPWQEQWRCVTRYYERIQEIYNGTFQPSSNEAWKDVISSFFVNVHHLYEWIENDTRVDSTARSAAGQFLRADRALKIADGFSNSHKHYARRKGLQVRVGSTTAGPGANSIRIDWKDLDTQHSSGQEDALDLAEACIASWRRFFRHHSLNPDG